MKPDGSYNTYFKYFSKLKTNYHLNKYKIEYFQTCSFDQVGKLYEISISTEFSSLQNIYLIKSDGMFLYH